VRRHGGRIRMESHVGEGTTVLLLLPAAAPSEAEHGTPAAAEDGKSAPGQGRILVMDDDSMVRHVITGMLRSLGYKTGEATDGEAAVREYAAAMHSAAPYDAVVLDLTVPGGMGGLEAVERMRREDPGLCAIVSSGYSADPVFSDPARYGFQAAVAKPCRKADLSRALQTAFRHGRR
jgi:CheY-like chemotaxis protein